uniref:Sialin n=1 Tax=Timema douglasi TaxID=61478 RepID=A0A7R8VKJ3_TIMDO|nr:unnamed protein product [Timema douglasi]
MLLGRQGRGRRKRTDVHEELEQTRFYWDEYQQNFMLGCFFWGYLCTELPGGRLAEIIGARRVFGYSMLAASIITVVTPAAANLSYIAVIILRVLLGLMGPQTHPQQGRPQTLTSSGDAISVQPRRKFGSRPSDALITITQYIFYSYSSPVASLVLTDSSQLTSDSQNLGRDVARHPPHDRSLDPAHGAQSVHVQHDGRSNINKENVRSGEITILTSSSYKRELEKLKTRNGAVMMKQKKNTSLTEKVKVKTSSNKSKEPTCASDGDDDVANFLCCSGLYSQSTEGWVASSLGAAITMPVCGYLIASLGWESVFYVTGVVGLLWSIAWFLVVFDSPAQHPRISNKERMFIENAIGSTTSHGKAHQVPWRQIVTSLPVWAIIITHGASVFGYFTVINQLPTYMKYILDFNIKEDFDGVLEFFIYLLVRSPRRWALLPRHQMEYGSRSSPDGSVAKIVKDGSHCLGTPFTSPHYFPTL